MSYEFHTSSGQYRAVVTRTGSALDVAIGSTRFRIEVTGREPNGRIRALVDGKPYDAVVRPSSAGDLQVFLEGHVISLLPPRAAPRAASDPTAQFPVVAAVPARGAVVSPIPGRVVLVRTRPGERVMGGDPLVVLEAMKMESTIRAPHPGRVERVLVAAGQTVQRGQELVRMGQARARVSGRSASR